MSPRLPSAATRRLRLLVLATIALGAGPAGILPGAASAAITNFAGTDPAGDSSSAPFDILSATAAFDSTKGQLTITITTGGSLADAEQAVFGYVSKKKEDGTCDIDGAGLFDGTNATFAYLVATSLGTQAIWSITGSDTSAPVTVTRSGATGTYVLGPDPALKALTPSCLNLRAQALTPGTDDPIDPVDELSIFVSTSAGGSGGSPETPSVVTPPAPVLTDQPDADRDGIADAADKCPAVAGASATGCLTTPAAKAFRLGAKRVVVDRLVPRTAAICPASVIAVVTAKGKRIGRGRLLVATRGSFCHVTGIVRLKRTAKKVRIVGRATGMGSVTKSLMR